MVEELYNSHDYCLLAEELEVVKAELAEVTADKINLINAAMDGGKSYHYIAHDMGYRDMQRKVKYLEADYIISNRELLIKQAEIQRLTAELADWKADAERLKTNSFDLVYGEYVICRYCGQQELYHDHDADCPILLHRQLVEKYGGENNQADVCSGGENNGS